MPYEENELFQTPDGDTPLWRYMDFARFVQMLESQTLWFSRADQFEDPFEGTLTDGEWKSMTTHVPEEEDVMTVSSGFLNIIPLARYTSFVNCWRIGETESLAMWDLYGKGSGIVAVKTTVGRLKQQLEGTDQHVFLAPVRYIDWHSAPFDNNLFAMLIRKDRSYAHESELRAFFQDMTPLTAMNEQRKNQPEELKTVWPDQLCDLAPTGQGLTVNLAELLTEVWVGPRERSWVQPLVEKVCRRYGLSTPIIASDRLVARIFIPPAKN